MKKHIIFLLFVPIIFLLSAINVLATSGACSGHGGVNCSAGAGYYGQVICNDGWTGSKVSYNSMAECLGYSDSDSNSNSDSTNLTADYNSQYNSLEQQILDIQTQYDKDVAAMQKQPVDLQFMNGEIQKLADTDNAKIQQIKLQEQQLYLNYQNALNAQQTQQPVCPVNSYVSNGQCLCNNGYVASGNVCISSNQACQNQYGINSYASGNQCYCNTGYQWNSSKTMCINITCPNNAILSGNQCVCNSGYVMNGGSCITDTQNCQNQFGANAYGDANYCYCNNGYAWNDAKTACIEIPPVIVPTPSSPPTTISLPISNPASTPTQTPIVTPAPGPVNYPKPAKKSDALSRNINLLHENVKKQKNQGKSETVQTAENTKTETANSNNKSSGFMGFVSSFLADISSGVRSFFNSIFK